MYSTTLIYFLVILKQMLPNVYKLVNIHLLIVNMSQTNDRIDVVTIIKIVKGLTKTLSKQTNKQQQCLDANS